MLAILVVFYSFFSERVAECRIFAGSVGQKPPPLVDGRGIVIAGVGKTLPLVDGQADDGGEGKLCVGRHVHAIPSSPAIVLDRCRLLTRVVSPHYESYRDVLRDSGGDCT